MRQNLGRFSSRITFFSWYLLLALLGPCTLSLAAIPGPPINVAVNPVGPSEAQITWSVAAADVNNVTGFNVSYEFGGNSLYDPAARSFNYFACPGKTVTYKVSAFNAEGSSAYVPASVTMPQQIPLQILRTWAYPSSVSAITVSYDSGMNCNTTGYKIERATSSTGEPPSSAYTQVGTVTSPGVQQWVDTTPVANTRYYYRVLAYNALGTAPPGPTANTMIAILAPSEIHAYIQSTTQIFVSWKPENQLVVTNFILERRTNTTSYAQIATTAMNIPQYTDTLPGQGIYFYRVKARNTTLLDSPYSPEVSIDFGPPSVAPSNLVVGPYKAYPGLNLSWTNTANNSQGYILERATAQNGPFTAIFTRANPLPVGYSDFDEQTAQSGITYYYRMANTNIFGDSGFSNVASGSYGTGGGPQPPTNLRVVKP